MQKGDAMNRRLFAGAGFLLCLGLALAVTAGAAVLKNNKTGEIITGTLTPQRINGMNVFKMQDGSTKFITPSEWTVMEADVGPAKDLPSVARTTCAYVIPISGPIESVALLEALDKALAEAKSRNAAVVIFRMNTPGGRIGTAEKIIQAIEQIDWATPVAFVSGPDKKSLSAGAYICFACAKIFMAPGTTMGAATPYSRESSGAAEVDEKMQSAFRARFRSLAQIRGHPGVVADAMVDSNSGGIVEVFIDNERRLVTEKEAERLANEHKDDGKFRQGKTVNPNGKILTLTSSEAAAFAIIEGIVPDEKGLLAEMGRPELAVQEASWLPGWVAKTTSHREKVVQDALDAFRVNIKQVMAYAEASDATSYLLPAMRYNKLAIGQLKKCAKCVTDLERMAKDERYELWIRSQSLSTLKAEMEALYTRLQSRKAELDTEYAEYLYRLRRMRGY